jgi:hypothetical protein
VQQNDEWKVEYLSSIVENKGKIDKNLLSNYPRKPKKLYKYVSLLNDSDKKIESFRENKMYLSSPLLFNDPYDCEFNTDISEQLKNVAQKLVKIEINKNASNRKERRDLQKRKKEVDKLITTEIKKLSNEFDLEWEKFRKTTAVCCLSEKKDYMLMWCNYADSYKGFCLEYDFEELIEKSMVLPVIYKNELTSLKTYINNMKNLNDLYVAGIHAVTVKSVEWRCENEWRIVDTLKNESKGKLIDVPTPKAIYLGNKICENTRKQLIDISKANKISNICDVTLNKEKYGLGFKSI